MINECNQLKSQVTVLQKYLKNRPKIWLPFCLKNMGSLIPLRQLEPPSPLLMAKLFFVVPTFFFQQVFFKELGISKSILMTFYAVCRKKRMNMKNKKN